MDTDAPTPEEAAQALHQINRQQADAVHRAFWAPWWFKLATVVLITGMGLSFDLTSGGLRSAVLWGCMLALFALFWLQRRVAAVRMPTFSPQRPSVRTWLFVAGIVVLILALPNLLKWLGAPLPYTFGYFAVGSLAMLAGTWMAPREEAERVAALADAEALDAASFETFASTHSTRRLWLIYLGVSFGVTLAIIVPIVVVSVVLGVPASVMGVVAVVIALATAMLTMRWFHRPLKNQQDADNA
jgi:hypothetical protein